MQIRRRAITVGTTFFLAAATGHVMQSGETISARLRDAEAAGGPVAARPVLASVTSTAATVPAATPAPAAVPAPPQPAPAVAARPAAVTSAPAAAAPAATELAATELAASAPAAPAAAEPAAPPPVLTGSGLPDLPRAEPAALGTDTRLAGRIEKLDSGYARSGTAADASYSVFGIACTDPALTLEPSARGMIRLTLAAPCFANERVTISHAGLVFAMATDQGGELDLMLPALTGPARVDVRFTSGETVSATRAVSGLDALARVAVLWQGAEGFHLHALEGGAGFDMPGHVSARGPRDRATAEGGFLTLLGDAGLDHPLMAEVYSAPAGTALDEMIVEAPVTEATCGRLLAGQALRLVAGAAPSAETLSFAMPGCDAAGDALLLALAPVAVPPVAVAAGAVTTGTVAAGGN